MTPAPKIAVIDVRRAIAETEQGLRVQATLKKLFESRQVDIEEVIRSVVADLTARGAFEGVEVTLELTGAALPVLATRAE